MKFFRNPLEKTAGINVSLKINGNLAMSSKLLNDIFVSIEDNHGGLQNGLDKRSPQEILSIMKKSKSSLSLVPEISPYSVVDATEEYNEFIGKLEDSVNTNKSVSITRW